MTEQEFTPTRESVSFEAGDKIVISPEATHLDKERKKLRETRKVMQVVKLLTNDYVLAKVTPKKNIRLQTS
eukprot:SAG11_NODE_28507_length_320_cov_14.393665_1_plen_70_part_10